MDHQELQGAVQLLPSDQVNLLRHHPLGSDHRGSPVPPRDEDSEEEVLRKLEMSGLSASRSERTNRDQDRSGRFLSEADGNFLRVGLRVSPLRSRLLGSQNHLSEELVGREKSHDRQTALQQVQLPGRRHLRVQTEPELSCENERN